MITGVDAGQDGAAWFKTMDPLVHDLAVSSFVSCGLVCSVWWRVRAYIDPAEPGRVEGVLPAVGAQRVGPGGEDGADEGAVLLRPRRSARPGRDRAPDHRPDPGRGCRTGLQRPGSGSGGRGAGSGVRGVAPA